MKWRVRKVGAKKSLLYVTLLKPRKKGINEYRGSQSQDGAGHFEVPLRLYRRDYIKH